MFDKRVISVDLGNAYTKIIEGKQIRDTVLVNQAIKIKTPDNSVENGKLINKEKIKNFLNNVIKENKIKSKKVVFTIQSTSVITREMILPYAKPNELENIVKNEVEQYLPIMLDDYVIQFMILDEIKEERNKQLKVQVTALPKYIIEACLDIIKDLKLKPLALDINSNSVSKLFNKGLKINDEKYSNDKTVATIDLGHNYINVNIIKDGKSLFSRVITKGGKDIDIRLANSFNLSLEDAERRKINNYNIDEFEADDITSSMLNEIVNNTIDEWINEIGRVFQYYMSRERNFKIDMIYLYGGSSKLKGLENILAEQL
ncbi:type IV pilus assembly protein PilM, partial [Caldisalinibacter kiritimatiensis]|uniref:type IV pilus assembly protein PilM n=1 Tax=Caldisalinibacter kiritimatiensis TaxID=1304284 RepID=UPI00054DED48